MQEVFKKIIMQLGIRAEKSEKKEMDAEHFEYAQMYKGERIAFGDAIEIVKKEAEEYNNGWIPCSERLPEESLQSVIGWDAYRERCVFVQYLGVWKLGNWEEVDITHWMDVPHTPKGE